MAVLRHQRLRVFDAFQRDADSGAADLQERHRGHLHVVLLQTESAGARRGETARPLSPLSRLCTCLTFRPGCTRLSLRSTRP